MWNVCFRSMVKAEIRCPLELWNFGFLCRKRFLSFSSSLASFFAHPQWKQRKEGQLTCPSPTLSALQRCSSSTNTCCLHRRGSRNIVRRLPHILHPPISNCFPGEDTASPASTPNRKNGLTNCQSFASLIQVGKNFLLLKKHIRLTLFSLLHKTYVFWLRITLQFFPITLHWEFIYQMQTTYPPESLETTDFHSVH